VLRAEARPVDQERRGVAVSHRFVFVGTVDGCCIALDQKTGKEKWQVLHLTDFANCHGCNFTSPLVVAGDVLMFVSTAGELVAQAKILGVEATPARNSGNSTPSSKIPRVGRVQAANVAAGRLDAWHLRCRNRHGVYGTGNPGKDFDVSDRKGGYLYTDSVALDDVEMMSAEIVNDI
jgi:alcohol dehydrogenase (cytochrome c)